MAGFSTAEIYHIPGRLLSGALPCCPVGSLQLSACLGTSCIKASTPYFSTMCLQHCLGGVCSRAVHCISRCASMHILDCVAPCFLPLPAHQHSTNKTMVPGS